MATEFDEQLKSRLLAFQRAHGLEETGVADTTTWSTLAGVADGPPGAGATAAAGALIGQVVTPTPTPTPGGLPQATLEIVEATWAGPSPKFGPVTATGNVLAGDTAVGVGDYAVIESAATVTEAVPVAEGAVKVGRTTLEGVRLLRAGRIVAGVAEGVGLAVVGAVVVAGTAYLVVEAMSHREAPTKPGEEYPGTSLPGGAPPPAVAPGATPPHPGHAPGAQEAPKSLPGADPPNPVHTPGPSEQPVEAPSGVIDDPVECAKLIKAGVRHYHHIFPRQFIHDFEALGINIDRYTIAMDPAEHIGSNGVHSTLDWNGQWYDLFVDLPKASLTEAAAAKWRTKVFALATILMEQAGMDPSKMTWYQKPNKPSNKP